MLVVWVVDFCCWEVCVYVECVCFVGDDWDDVVIEFFGV